MHCLVKRPFDSYHQTPTFPHRGISSSVFGKDFKNVSDETNRQFAIVAVSNLEPLKCEPGHKKFYEYERARKVTQIHQSLLNLKFNPFRTRLLFDKPSAECYNKFNFHSPEETDQFKKVPVDGSPTYANIHKALDEFSLDARPGDTVWFFLDGHGNRNGGFLLNKSPNSTSPTASPSYLRTKDFERSMSRFDKGVHFNIVLDCCGAGSFLPFTNPHATLLAACKKNELTFADFKTGEGYVTRFLKMREKFPDEGLLPNHLKALTAKIPGYDSLSYLVDNYFDSKDWTEKIPPTTAKPSSKTALENLEIDDVIYDQCSNHKDVHSTQEIVHTLKSNTESTASAISPLTNEDEKIKILRQNSPLIDNVLKLIDPVVNKDNYYLLHPKIGLYLSTANTGQVTQLVNTASRML